jgi:hypothetical protein
VNKSYLYIEVEVSVATREKLTVMNNESENAASVVTHPLDTEELLFSHLAF